MPDARRALAALGAAARTDDRCGVAQLVSPGLAEAAAALASAALALQAYAVVAAPPRFGGRGGTTEAVLGASARPPGRQAALACCASSTCCNAVPGAGVSTRTSTLGLSMVPVPCSAAAPQASMCVFSALSSHWRH